MRGLIPHPFNNFPFQILNSDRRSHRLERGQSLINNKRLVILEPQINVGQNGLAGDTESFFKAATQILDDLEPALEQVDVVVLEQAFEQSNVVRGFTGDDCLGVGFLYEIFQVLLFLLPFLQRQYSVDPAAVEVGQHVDRDVVLFVLLGRVHFLALLALFQPPLDFHRLLFVGFAPFYHLFLAVCVHVEEIEGVFARPLEGLLEKLYHLGFCEWLCSCEELEVFAENLQISKPFWPVIVQ